MKKLTYILAAAMAVYALNACGSRGHGADSGEGHDDDHEAHSAVHSHDSEHNHTGHSHEHATHDHSDHNHSEEAHAPGIIEFSSEQAPACHPDRNVVIQFRQAGYRSFVQFIPPPWKLPAFPCHDNVESARLIKKSTPKRAQSI